LDMSMLPKFVVVCHCWLSPYRLLVITGTPPMWPSTIRSSDKGGLMQELLDLFYHWIVSYLLRYLYECPSWRQISSGWARSSWFRERAPVSLRRESINFPCATLESPYFPFRDPGMKLFHVHVRLSFFALYFNSYCPSLVGSFRSHFKFSCIYFLSILNITPIFFID
jgi:hypothetical protein